MVKVTHGTAKLAPDPSVFSVVPFMGWASFFLLFRLFLLILSLTHASQDKNSGDREEKKYNDVHLMNHPARVAVIVKATAGLKTRGGERVMSVFPDKLLEVDACSFF